MTFSLPDEIVTLQQAQLLRLDVERLIDVLQESARRQKPEAAEISVLIKKTLGSNKPTLENLQALQRWLLEVARFPVIHITLPALPGIELRQKLAAWFRGNISPSLLLAFEYNSGLGGGFALRAGGTVFDFSFRTRLLQSSGSMKSIMSRPKFAADSQKEPAGV